MGGNVTEGAPAFPRARYVMSRRDWERWTTKEALGHMPPATAEIVRNQLLPLEANGVLDLLEGETEIAPGIRVLPAPGHTPGHLAVEVANELLYLTDSFLHPLQAARPEWGHGVDEDPETASATVRALLERAAASGLPITGSHLEARFRVERAGDAFDVARV